MSNISEVTALSVSPNALRLQVRLLGEGRSFPIPGHRPSWAALLLCAVEDVFDPSAEWLARVWQLAEQVDTVRIRELTDYPETTPRTSSKRVTSRLEVDLSFRDTRTLPERLGGLTWPDEGWAKFARRRAEEALSENWTSHVSASFRRTPYWRKEVGWTKARVSQLVPKRWEGTPEEAEKELRQGAIACCWHIWDVLPSWSDQIDTLSFTMDFLHTTTVAMKLPSDDERVQESLMVMLGEADHHSLAACRLGALGPSAGARIRETLQRAHELASRGRDRFAPISAWALWRVTGDADYITDVETKPRILKRLIESLRVQGRGLSMPDDFWLQTSST